ncbi:zinc-binding dehydrogenase [Georgenia yuyongxinii]
MKAWQFTGTHQPLVLNEIPAPTPGPGEVVLDIRAAGLCHSDVGVLEDEGWLSSFPRLPMTMGHEVAGVIVAVGEGVTEWAVGDRVGVCPTAGGDTVPGYSRDGGFTAQHLAPAADLVRMPEGLSFELAAAGTDAGMTSYHAVKTIGGVKAGDKVAIVGLGGLGQIGARVAVVLGAEVYVAEVNEDVWPLAQKIGATEVVKDVAELAGRDLDVVVDYAGFGTTTADALKAIRPGGTVVVVGMGKLEATISTYDVIMKQARILGSMGGTKQDVADCYELFAAGQVTPVVTTIGFGEIPEGVERLRRGEVTGRLVALMA